MAVSYNRELGVWQVNGRGAYATQAEAASADTGGAAPAPPSNDTGGFQMQTGGPAQQPGTGPAAPLDRAPVRTAPAPFQPYVAGYSGGGRTVSGGATGNTAAAVAAHQSGNIGGAGGAFSAVSQAGQAAFQQMHDQGRSVSYGSHNRLLDFDGRNTVPRQPAAPGAPADPDRGLASSPAEAGVAPPQNVPGDPGAAVPNTAGPRPAQATVDRTAYDAAAQGLTQARDDFYAQLTKLSGVDPFGNQAFLQKATDRAVAQAAGTAAGARGGAAAQAGAQRQAVGVQGQLAARGTQEVAEAGRRDAVQAAQLGIQTVGGIADVNKQLAENELALSNQALQAGEQNLRAYLGGRELDQAEKESVRRLATAVAQIDMERYKTDVGYRESVNQNLTAMYQSDNALKGVKMQVDAQENLSPDEWMMGLVGMGAGLAQGVIASDRRKKTAIKPAKVSELREYLASAPGSHYQYRSPSSRGQRPGDNYGPMAQDLAKTKIGRTVVVEKADGLYVDTGRLALADHAALTHLAQRVERLAARLAPKAKKTP